MSVIHRAGAIDDLLRETMTARAARLGMYAALVTLAACVARLYVQSRRMNGDAATDPLHLRTMVMCVAAACAAIAFWFAWRRPATSGAVAGLAAVVLAFSPGLGSHAVA